MRTKRRLMALVPLVVMLGCLIAQDGTAQGPEPATNEHVDALITLITIAGDCMPTMVTPDPVKAHRGSQIRWGVTSECDNNVTVSIAMKDAQADPLETCTRTTEKKKYKAGKPIKCKVKSDALGKYGYSVSADGKTLDPEIEVYQ